VAIRPEPFGALAYHYDNRKLNFLRSPDLVELVQNLGSYSSPRLAFDQLHVAADHWRQYAMALDALAHSDFLEPVADQP
jgi:putative mycofactocin binding protein MftB